MMASNRRLRWEVQKQKAEKMESDKRLEALRWQKEESDRRLQDELRCF